MGKEFDETEYIRLVEKDTERKITAYSDTFEEACSISEENKNDETEK